MSVNFQVDLGELNSAMNRVRRSMNASVPKVFKSGMSLFVSRMQSFTLPRTLKQGERATERDIAKAVRPLNADTFAEISDPKLKQRLTVLTHKRDEVALKKILNNIGGGWSRAQIVPFAPELHTSQRDRRGHVRRGANTNLTWDTTAYFKYVATVVGRVGWARAGWNAAARMLGIPDLPTWVSRHGTAGGTSYGNPRDEQEPNITMVNAASKIPGYEQQVQQAANSAARDMHKDLERAVDKAIRE